MQIIGDQILYKGGVMKNNQEYGMLTLELTSGQYLIYTHIDPTRITGLYPDSAAINVHSSSIVELVPIHDEGKYKNALNEAFLNDGLRN